MSDLRIHAALSPRVAVLSSPDVDRVIQLNGIPDLTTLLRPFESSVERLSVRTSQLETRICDRFPLRFDPYSLFNPDAARAISNTYSQPAPRPSAVVRSNEELLDRVNHLIATNIKKWDAHVPRPDLAAHSSQPKPQQEDDEDDVDDREKAEKVLDGTLAKLQRGSLEEISPWFAAVQQLVFGQRTIAKHESFGHPVAVLLAVSSASPDPMNDFAKLYEATSQASPFPAHPYINPDTLKYYVLIHDVHTSGPDLVSSKEILEQIKKTYGLHCCLLAINSALDSRAAPPTELAALWSPYVGAMPTSPTLASPSLGSALSADVPMLLDEEDVKRIKGFIRELTAQSIVPFMERYVQHMADHLANSRRGLTNRFFGASRKLFGGVAGVGGSSGDKSGSGSSTSGGLAASGGYDSQHEYYPYSSIEAQTRRLADFAFTIRDYKLAASMYDLGRKDFAGDKAYRHAAGATEMFGLSHLLIMYTSRSPRIDVDSYLAQACHEYALRSTAHANAAVVDENHALRATLLYYEAYRMLGYLRPAPTGLLRMSLQSEEVLAPLLLEQAALACLQLSPKPALRKFALHLVTAAHKYQACGQKILSLRCYAQAAVIYREKGWTLIENHIEHELGMQAYNEGDSDAAVAHLIKLIRPSTNSSAEHETFLKDMQTAYKYSARAEQDAEPSTLEAATTRLALPFPIFDTASASLRFVPESSASATLAVEDTVWDKLEQELVDHGLGERTLPDGSKKRRKRPTGQTSTQARQVPINQTFWLDVEVRNPLSVELTIDAIHPILMHSGSPSDADASQQLNANDFESDDVGRLTLEPFERRRLRIAMRVRVEAKSLRVASVTFRLADTIQLFQHLEKKGKRLNGTKEQRTSMMYGPDLSLALSVHCPRPTLTARIVDPPMHMFLGEQVSLKVVLKNEGSSTIEDLRALSNQPEVATFVADATSLPQGTQTCSMPNHLGACKPQYVLDNGGQTILQPEQEIGATLIVRPVRTGVARLAWLLPFSSEDGETYLSRMALSTHVSSAVQISVETKPGRSTSCIHDVLVEVINKLTQDDVRLDALSVLSPHWQIAGNSTGGSQAVIIPPMQTWRGALQIEEIGSEQVAAETEQYTATKLQDLLLSRDTRRPDPSDVELRLSSQRYDLEIKQAWTSSSLTLHREARKTWRIKSLASTFPTMTWRDRLGAFTLWESRDLDVVLQFSITSRNANAEVEARAGQVQVNGVQPGPMRSQIRAITHPRLQDSTTKAGQVRSLYAETIKQKVSLLQNILSSRLGSDQNPAVIYIELLPKDVGAKNTARKYRFVVRNFSDLYQARVEVQLLDSLANRQDGASAHAHRWIGRKTLRCVLEAGSNAQLVATCHGDDAASPRFDVVTESYLPNSMGEGDTTHRGELVARYVEHY